MTPLLTPIILVIMGWPGILGSLLVSVAGILLKRPALLVAGAVLSLGFAWYLRAWPNPVFDMLGYSLPVLHLLGAWAVARRKAWAAWPLLLPHVGIAAYLGAMVLSQ
jgi:predicted membrane channel-forming protein YqfA (hemolysin III family)